MAGKMCFGEVFNNSYNPKATKAFSEGLHYRAGGTALERPATDNPHEEPPLTNLGSSPSWLAWDNGWLVADSASPSAVSQSDAPCVAVPTNAVPA